MMMISSFATPFSLLVDEDDDEDDGKGKQPCGWMTLFLVSDVFFLATASSRPRHDWILEYAPPFLIIIIFFSFLHHTFDKHLIRYPTLALATRHDTIRYFFFLFFFLSFWN